MKDKKSLLSLLWVFTLLNYLYCDVVSLMDARLLRQYLDGNVGGMEISQGFLFGASVLMEISILMLLLSAILPEKLNRRANIAAGVVTTIVQAATLLMGKPAPYYLFFSLIEISTTLYITWLAWTWLPNNLKTA